jgi:hypothetical protein
VLDFTTLLPGPMATLLLAGSSACGSVFQVRHRSAAL